MSTAPLVPVCPKCLHVCTADEFAGGQCSRCWRDAAEDASYQAQQLNAETRVAGDWWDCE